MKEKHNSGDDVLSRTAWHPAFLEALKAELDEYRDILEFHDEYQLTAEPLRIDCVIIKKAEGAIVKKSIAAIFRRVNLLEYKRPDKSLSIDDFYKVHSYATLYASLRKTPITDITVSFVGSRQPVKVIKHLRSVCGYTVEKTHPGIYNVLGAIFPIQFIDSCELSADENLLLRSLRKLDLGEGVDVIKKISLRGKKRGDGLRLGAYLAVMLKHNAAAIQEVLKMGGTASPTLETVLREAGLIAKWQAEAKAEAEARILEIARNCIEHGFPLDAVVSVTKLDPETVRKLAGGIYQ